MRSPSTVQNGSSYGRLRVAAGAALTLRGYDQGSNLMGLVNQYGRFEPQPGSIVLGDLASDFQSGLKVLGNIIAQGSAGSRITFGVPAANVGWAKAVTTQTIANPAFYDANRKLYSVALADTNAWGNVANTAGTAQGSYGDSSYATDATSTTDHSVLIASVAESSLANLIAAADSGTPYGHFYLDHDTGILYYYSTVATPTLKFTYKRLDRQTANWRGWTIFGGSASGSSAIFDYCDVQYMGTAGGGFAYGPSSQRCQVPIYFASLPAGGFSLTNSNFSKNFGVAGLDACAGSSGSRNLVQSNVLNYAGKLQFNGGLVFCAGGTSYLKVDNNQVNAHGPLVNFFRNPIPFTVAGQLFDHANAEITGNTGVCAGSFIAGTGPALPCGTEIVPVSGPAATVTSNLLASGNDLSGGGGILDGRCFDVGISGSAASPAIVEQNHLHHYHRLGPHGGYADYRKNRFGHCYHHGFTGSTGDDNYFTDVFIRNNLFYNVRGASGTEGSPAVITGYNHRTVLNNIQVVNNTLDGNKCGLVDIGDSQDGTTGHHVTNMVVANNCIAQGGYAFQRNPDGTTTTQPKNRAHVLEWDFNCTFGQATAYGVGFNNNTKASLFSQGGAKYNRLGSGSRNVLGVALFDASYTTDQAGRNLVYTVNALGQNHTLAWGSGDAVQLVLDYGTSAGGGRRTLACAGKSWAYTGNTTQFDLKANWLYIVSGTNAGFAATIMRATANTAYAATVQAGGSGWVVGQHAKVSSGGTVDSGGYSAVVKVTGVSGGAVTGVEIINGGTYSTVPSNPVSMQRIDGGSGASLTLNFSWAPGLLFAPDLPASCDATSVFSIIQSEVKLFDTAGSSGGSVKAGTYLKTADQASATNVLPVTSQTDSGITVSVAHSVTGNPNWASLGSVASGVAADYHLGTGSSCVDAGTSDNAPSDDFFGTARPARSGYDIGFSEEPASTSPIAAATSESDTTAGTLRGRTALASATMESEASAAALRGRTSLAGACNGSETSTGTLIGHGKMQAATVEADTSSGLLRQSGNFGEMAAASAESDVSIATLTGRARASATIAESDVSSGAVRGIGLLLAMAAESSFDHARLVGRAAIAADETAEDASIGTLTDYLPGPIVAGVEFSLPRNRSHFGLPS